MFWALFYQIKNSEILRAKREFSLSMRLGLWRGKYLAGRTVTNTPSLSRESTWYHLKLCWRVTSRSLSLSHILHLLSGVDNLKFVLIKSSIHSLRVVFLSRESKNFHSKALKMPSRQLIAKSGRRRSKKKISESHETISIHNRLINDSQSEPESNRFREFEFLNRSSD